MKIRLSPEQQIQGHREALGETEFKLERSGVDVFLLRAWLDQSLHLRDLQERHQRGALEAVEYDPDEDA